MQEHADLALANYNTTSHHMAEVFKEIKETLNPGHNKVQYF